VARQKHMTKRERKLHGELNAEEKCKIKFIHLLQIEQETCLNKI
jgi:hypothetical protein